MTSLCVLQGFEREKRRSRKKEVDQTRATEFLAENATLTYVFWLPPQGKSGSLLWFLFRYQELCQSWGGRPRLPVPNSPYGLCGCKSTLNSSSELRSCVKVEEAVRSCPSLKVHSVRVDVKQHWTTERWLRFSSERTFSSAMTEKSRAWDETSGSIIGGNCHKYHFSRDKRRILSRQKYAYRGKSFVATKLRLSHPNFCRDKHVFVHTDKHTFVASKDVFCRDKSILDKHKLVATMTCFVATNTCLSRQTNTCLLCVATKIILVAAPANNRGAGTALPTPV